jgi:hypothetical protein
MCVLFCWRFAGMESYLRDGSCVSTDPLVRDWRCVFCFRELRFDTPFLLPILHGALFYIPSALVLLVPVSFASVLST